MLKAAIHFKYVIIFILSVYISISEVDAAVINANSCSYADVSSAVSSANIGDTINVPAGSCTWNSRMRITKGINLIGAGIGNTVITIGDVAGAIFYKPDTTRNDPFRISGFTFDLNDNAQDNFRGALFLGENKVQPYTVQTNIRIDHNRFHNGAHGYQSIFIFGMQGVIDNNVFEDVYHPFRANAKEGGGQTWWDNVNYEFGADHTTSDGTMWVENNIIKLNPGTLASCQGAGRYSFRYNDITPVGDTYPLIDLHGDAGHDCYGSEVYGNFIDPSSTGDEIRVFDQRGGKVLIFNNYIDARANFQVRSQTSAHETTNLQPTNVSDSYYWGNRKIDGALATAYVSRTTDDNPTQDTDFFQDQTGFDATSGVGMGTLAARPSSCTTGVGYWATNQSTTDLTGMTGVNPITPISGTLYKCIATNTWTPYYTPLVYPHPLTTGIIDTLAPAVPTFLSVL